MLIARKNPFQRLGLSRTALASLCLFFAVGAQAQTWTGGGPDSNIDDSINWGGANPPFDGSAIVTFASGGTNATMDVPASFSGITFNANTSFTLDGPSLLSISASGISATLPAAISQTNTIGSPLKLTANQTWSIYNNDVGTNTLAISDILNGQNGSPTLSGDGTVIFSGISDNTNLTATINSGFLILNKTSSSTVHAIEGSLNINGGTARLAGTGGDQILDTASVGCAGGAVFDLNGQTETFARLNLNGTGINAGGGLINSSTTAAVLTTPLLSLRSGGIDSVGGTGDITVNGVMNGSLNSLTKVGNNALTLSGTTDNSGLNATVNGGVLVLGKTSSSSVHSLTALTINSNGTVRLGGTGGDQIPDPTAVACNSGGVFDLNGQTETIARLNLTGTGINGGGSMINSSTSPATLIIPLLSPRVGGDVSIGGTGDITVNGVINGFFEPIIKINTNTLILSGTTDNANLGATVNGGVLVLGKTSSSSVHAIEPTGASSNLTINASGTVQLAGTGGDQIWDSTLVICTNGGVFDLNGQSETIGATPAGAVVGGLALGNGILVNSNVSASALAGYVTLNNNVTVGGNGAITIDAYVSGPGGITKVGTDIVTLTSTNSYRGNTLANGGTLEIVQATIATNSTVTVSGGSVLQLDFAGMNAVSSLVLNGVTQPAGIYNSTTGAPYITGSGSLLVSSSVPPATNITFSINGNQLVLDWPTGQGWHLQAQTNASTGLTATWFDVTGVTPPFTNTVDQTNLSVFFRLKY